MAYATAIFLLLTLPNFIYAGPGGAIAKAVTKNKWLRALLFIGIAILVIIFLPFIIMEFIKEKQAKKRVLDDLRFLSARDSRFDWLKIRRRVLNCFNRVHQQWDKGEKEWDRAQY